MFAKKPSSKFQIYQFPNFQNPTGKYFVKVREQEENHHSPISQLCVIF